MDANLGAVIAAQDSVILGRRSYEEWAEFWPGSDLEPFATFINGVTKFVATSTPLDRTWANATVVDGELVEFVRDLKNQPGADIGVHASISVAQALLAAGVVDELRLVIAPAIAGGGRRLLERLAGDSARVDRRRDLTDGLSAPRLPRHRVRRAARRGQPSSAANGRAPPNLDIAARPVVDSRGGHREQFAVSARRPATKPPHEDRPKAMNLPKNAPIAFRLVTPPSGADDGRSAPASS